MRILITAEEGIEQASMNQLPIPVDGAIGGSVVDYRKGSVISVSQGYAESLPIR